MKKLTGFTFIEILIVIAVFIITLAGGVVVWETKVTPGLLVSPTLTTAPLPSTQPQVKKDLDSWFDCSTNADCIMVPHPCCPNAHTIAANKSIAGLVVPSCEHLPFICASEIPRLPLGTPVGCINNKCIILTGQSLPPIVNEPTTPPTTAPTPTSPSALFPPSCQTDADCYDDQGNPVGICNVPCQDKAVCEDGICIKPILNIPGIQ